MTRVLVVLKALPTYLAILSTVLTVVAAELVPLLPEHTAVQVGAWITIGLAWIAGLVATIARLTPAVPGTYGLLPPTEG